MGRDTAIEWTQSTWNPVTGCTKTSPGCANCYAERMARRLQAMGQANYRNGFRVTVHEHMLNRPLEWRDGQSIFVNSMSDLFHQDVPTSFIRRVFDVMVRARQHVFQVLTKRSERLADLAPSLPWPDNVWTGVSVESADYVFRMDDLRQVPARVRFISFEPLLGPVGELDLGGIDWVIVGGESGPGARPMEAAWATDIRDQCAAAEVPFFFKQWGGMQKKRKGRVLEGVTHSAMPDQTPVSVQTTYAAVDEWFHM
jgi:protein gp37